MKRFRKLSLFIVMIFTMATFFSNLAFADTVYTVKSGDTLWGISKNYGLNWKEVSDYNKLENPSLIFPGQKITIPSKEEEKTNTTITLLQTSDMHGRIYAYDYATDSVDKDAGLAKVQTLVKQERAKNKNVILMDTGDLVQDNSAQLFNDDPIHPMIAALNYMKYDTWTLGNHEFNFDKSFLENNIETFKNTVLAANIYKEDGTRFVEPYKIFVKDGVRVAVVGLIAPNVPNWEAANPEHYAGLKFTGTVEEAKKVVKELEGKYDVLVGAFHLGEEGEHGYEGATAIAEACPEFNVMFIGHAHSQIADEVVNGVKLVEPGRFGWALGKADITLNKENGKWVVKDVTTANLETYDVEEDPDMIKEFAYVHERALGDANTVVGEVTDDFISNVDYITGEKEVTTMPTVQLEDTALIDLINEVQMFYAEAQISSAAAFKDDMNLLKGEFKNKDAANIYKYDNTLMGVNITGANLREYMEWSASYYNTYKPGDVTISFNPEIRGYNYDMFSGVTYDINISKEGGSRIENLKLNGEDIKDDAVYKLAVNNYRFGTLLGLGLVTEADKYYDSSLQTTGAVRDLIKNYIEEEKGGKIVPSVDNNWKITGADLDNPLKDVVYDMIKKGEISIPRSEDGRTPNVKAINVNELKEEGKLDGYKTLTLLHTNDMHGFFIEGAYDGMGAAKLAAKVNEIRTKDENVLLLDAGDAIQGSNLVTLSKGENAIKVMNEMKYDAMTVGNHEFDYGQERLIQLKDMANFPIVAANIKKDDGTNFLQNYIIKEMNGVKVGVFGLATPETKFKSAPKNSEGLTFEDPIETAKAMVEELQGKVDVIVALAHLGIEGDYTSLKLAENVNGIDVIIDGHSHTELLAGNTVNGTLIVQNGEKTKDLGIVKLAIKDGKVVTKFSAPYTKAQSINGAEDEAVKAIIDEAAAANEAIENEVVANSPVELDGLRENVRTGETNLGNLIIASMMDVSGADVALANGGGIRASIPAGDVTKGNVLTVLPFGNTVRVIEVTGADIKAAIENGIDEYPSAKGAFPHIGGMTVTFDSTKEAGNRVVEILVGGKALEENKNYKLVTNDFISDGGDGYTMFKGKKVVGEYDALDQVLIQYIQENGFDAAETDGRIKDISSEMSMLDMPLAA